MTFFVFATIVLKDVQPRLQHVSQIRFSIQIRVPRRDRRVLREIPGIRCSVPGK